MESPPTSPFPPDIEAHVWRGLRQISGQLKVGLLMRETDRTEQWASRVIWLLIAEPCVKLEVVFRLHGVPEPRDSSSALFKVVHRASAQHYAPFRKVSLSVKPACCFVDLQFAANGEVSEDTAAKIKSRELDVLIWLESEPLPVASGEFTRLGVWSFRMGRPDSALSRPPYWSDVLDEQQVSEITLLRHTSGCRGVQAIGSHVAATDPSWRFTQTAEQMTSIAGPLLLRGLLDALDDERAFLSNLPPCTTLERTLSHDPSATETARFLAARMKHSVRVRSGERRGMHRKWFSAIRNRQEHEFTANSGEAFRELPRPIGSEYADPFLLERRGRHWLCFEEVPPGRDIGRLSMAELKDDGTMNQPFVILEKPYHLSYPMVFEHGDDVYFVPESAQAKVVELYRATDFPVKWELTSTLMKGIPLVDTTVFFHDDCWFFFTTTRAPVIETFLFYADRLEGTWQYHPRNPICSDVRRARGAGALYFRGGKLIRPSQDSSINYGGAIVLNEIKRLSKTEYREEPIHRIHADWSPGLLGTHTINSDSKFEVIDGVRWER